MKWNKNAKKLKIDISQMMKTSHEEVERANKKQPWKPFWNLIRKVKFPWILIAVCTLLYLVQGELTLLFPSYTEKIYNGEFTVQLAVTAVLVVLGKALMTAIIQCTARYTSYMNRMRFQNYIWRKLSRLPLSYFEKNEPRDLISRTTSDVTTMSEFMSFDIASVASTLYTFVGSLILINAYDWKLLVSQLICIPLTYAIGVLAGRIYFKTNNRVQSRLSDMTRYFATVLPYITLTKLYGQENREHAAGNSWIDSHFKTEIQSSVYNLGITFANTVTALIRTLTIIFVGLWLIRRGDIDVGQWIAFYQYANLLDNNFQSIMTMWQKLKRNQGLCARISAATDVEPEENKGTLDARQANGKVAFENVTFAYEDKNVLHDVSFTAEAGEITAIVGPSGAGKSTLLNLTERFYLPKDGAVTLDGVNAQDYELHSWRKNIGYIPQDAPLLSGTIAENMAHGVEGEVSKEKLEEAARRADILDYIRTLPQGFDTPVGENGAKLSGGQKQRIAIARALLMDSKILLLDEATSNLDAEAEYNIEQTLKEISRDRTVLMVAHRMKTVEKADKILVLDNSRIAAEGTHESLMKDSPLYRHLVELQTDAPAA